MNRFIENIGESQNCKEKICSFYVNDYHFEMITLEYIKRVLNKDKNIVILTQNNLKNTASKIINKIDVNDVAKKSILNIDWDNENKNKLEKIKRDTNNGKDIIVFVKGESEFIRDMDTYLNNNVNIENLELIHCYNMFEFKFNIDDIISNYTDVLNVSGKMKF